MYDLHFDTQVDNDCISQALQETFNTPSHLIKIVPEINIDRNLGKFYLLCKVYRDHGEFMLHLSIYPQKAELKKRSESEIAESLTKKLKCRCLVSDESVNPYTWNLVDQDGHRTPVSLQTEALDFRSELSVKATRS